MSHRESFDDNEAIRDSFHQHEPGSYVVLTFGAATYLVVEIAEVASFCRILLRGFRNLRNLGGGGGILVGIQPKPDASIGRSQGILSVCMNQLGIENGNDPSLTLSPMLGHQGQVCLVHHELSLEPKPFPLTHGCRRRSARTVRFCVGDATTTCRAAKKAEKGGRGENSSSSPSDRDLDGVPETPTIEYAKAPLFQGGKAADAWTEAPSAEEADKPEEAEVELPFCFMTLALNAMPFITHHASVFDEIGQILSKRAAAAADPVTPNGNNKSSRAAGNARASSGNSRNPEKSPAPPPPAPGSFWEWHVVEGVAAGRANHGNPYSRRRIPDRYFETGTGLSVDGTTQYLDGLVGGGAGANAPSSSPRQRVYVHRRCGGSPESRRTSERPTGTEAGSNRGEPSTENSTETPGTGANADTEGSSERANAGTEGNSEHDPRVDGVGGNHAGFDGGGGGSEEGGPGSTHCLWRDKIQMVNSVAFSLEHECLLVQIDADELWTAEQLVRLRDMFLLERNGSEEDGGSGWGAAGAGGQQGPASAAMGQLTKDTSFVNRKGRQQQQQQQQHNLIRKSRECAYFDCHFFVGPDLVTITEDGWGHSTSNEWLRAWVFRPRQSVWLQHAPPELARHDETVGWQLLAGDQCIGRAETRERGLVFTHYAYVLEEQVGWGSPGCGIGVDICFTFCARNRSPRCWSLRWTIP